MVKGLIWNMESKDWLDESLQEQNKALVSPAAMSVKLL